MSGATGAASLPTAAAAAAAEFPLVAVVAGAVAGLLLLIALMVGIACLAKRKKASRKTRDGA